MVLGTGPVCLYILKKWRSRQVTQVPHSQTLKHIATQLSGRIDHQNDDDVMKRMVMKNRKLQFLKLPVQRG